MRRLLNSFYYAVEYAMVFLACFVLFNTRADGPLVSGVWCVVVMCGMGVIWLHQIHDHLHLSLLKSMNETSGVRIRK